MPVLSEAFPPSAHEPSPGSNLSKTQNKYIFGSLALVFVFLFFLQRRLISNHKCKRRDEKGIAAYSHEYSTSPASHSSRDAIELSSAARISFPSALPEKQYPIDGSRSLQSNKNPSSISSAMQPSSSSSSLPLPFDKEEIESQNLTALPARQYSDSESSSSHPGFGADTAFMTNFSQGHGQGQGQGHEDDPSATLSSQAKPPPPPPSKSRILRPPQTTPPPISASKPLNLGASITHNPTSTITATTTSTKTTPIASSRRSSSGSSLIHPDLPDPSISLNTAPSGPKPLSIFTGYGQGQANFEPQYPLTFVPSPTEYTSFEAMYSQNPPYYEASSSSEPIVGTEYTFPDAENPSIPRRRSYTKSLSNGSEVSGEIIVSSSGIEGQGWRRHTRVFGGGVCKACEESKGVEMEIRRLNS